jgi:hypothetical protein
MASTHIAGHNDTDQRAGGARRHDEVAADCAAGYRRVAGGRIRVGSRQRRQHDPERQYCRRERLHGSPPCRFRRAPKSTHTHALRRPSFDILIDVAFDHTIRTVGDCRKITWLAQEKTGANVRFPPVEAIRGPSRPSTARDP